MRKADVRKVLAALRSVAAAVSPYGRFVAVMLVATWVGGSMWAWQELQIIAAICLVLLGAAGLFALGRLSLDAVITVEPPRVVVGERAAGALVLRNSGRRPIRGLRVELRVGRATASFAVPVIRPDSPIDELFVVPTNRRAVIAVGPVTTVQGDPLGMIERRRTWSATEEIFVHPRTVHLSSISAGLIRDLEGHTTPHLSPSDIAFHTLRDYVPGDDRRHVHWKSSAKNGRLLVRQYVDTRRSHVAVLLSIDRDEFASDDEFELAVSCAASVAAQSSRDDQTLSVIVGEDQFGTESIRHVLDRFSGVEPRRGQGGVDAVLRAARRKAPDASVVVVCVGSKLTVPEIRRAATRISLGTSSIVLRSDLDSAATFRIVGTSRFLNVPDLAVLNGGLERVLA